MKLRLLLAALACAAPLLAQPSAPPAYPPSSPEQLETLVSPIALYPDPLLSVILPSATAPGNVVLAARFVGANQDPAAIDAQPWDESVKALAHYPELISWMDQNLEWTQQLGAAFLDQPADVMNAIQRLRTSAREAGILVDTPQQQVIVQQQYVYIVPAQPDVIYVPSYDPQIFYSSYGYPRGRSALSFSIGFSTGPWLAYEPDWGRRTIWIDRQRDWSQRRDWRPAPQREIVVNSSRQQWRPSVDVSTRQRVTHNTTINRTGDNRTRMEIARPAPFTAPNSGPSRRSPDMSVRTAPQTRAPESLPPTGRVAEPRADRNPRYETPAPVAQPPPPPSAGPAPVAAPPSFPARERNDRSRETSNDRRDNSPPPPSAERALNPPPAPRATPAPPAKGPPPQAQSAEPSPKGKAKGKDRNDEEEDPKKRRRDD